MPKIVFVGDTKSGKTTTLQRYLGHQHNGSPTMGVEVYDTDVGQIWDCAGSEKYRGLGDAYYFDTDAFVIFVRSDAKIKKTILRWITETRRVSPNAKCACVITYLHQPLSIDIPHVALKIGGPVDEIFADLRYI